jgi:HlyD family secretion protein
MGRSGGGGLAGAAGSMPNGRGRRPTAGAKPQTVYLLGADKKLKPAHIRTGITDGRYTQVISGDVKEGDPVVVGLATAKVEGPPPMGGTGPGGGQRGGGGRRN